MSNNNDFREPILNENRTMMFVVAVASLIMIGGIYIFTDSITGLITKVSPKVTTASEHVVTDIDFEYDESFWRGDRSKVSFKTANGLIVYPRGDVHYYKMDNDNVGITISVREYDKMVDNQVRVYVGESEISDIQTKYASTYKENIEWQN